MSTALESLEDMGFPRNRAYVLSYIGFLILIVALRGSFCLTSQLMTQVWEPDPSRAGGSRKGLP